MEDQLLLIQVQTNDLIVDHSGSRELCKRTQVDVGIVKLVVSGHQTRQHSGIGGVNVSADQCQAHPWQRLHAETLEYGHLAVATPDQHQILDYRSPYSVHVLARAARSRAGSFEKEPAGPPWRWSPNRRASSRRLEEEEYFGLEAKATFPSRVGSF